MNTQELLKKWIEIDQNYANLKFTTEGETSSTRSFNFIFDGKIILQDKFWIYRILSKKDYNKIMSILQITEKTNISFFLPQTIIYEGKNFNITKQKKVLHLDSHEIRKKYENITLPKDKESIYQTSLKVINNNSEIIERMIYDFYPEDYDKIAELTKIIKIKDITYSNCGMYKNKIVCYDYELSERDMVFEEVQNFIYKYSNDNLLIEKDYISKIFI